MYSRHSFIIHSKKIWKRLHRWQSKMARYGAVKYALLLISDEEDDVMDAAVTFLEALLDGGNLEVQRATMQHLEDLPDLECWLRLRDEMQRSLSALLMHARNEAMGAPEDDDNGNQFNITMGDSTLGGTTTLTANQLSVIADALGNLRARQNKSKLLTRAAKHKENREYMNEFLNLTTLYRVLQLFVEGAFMPLQDHLREQKGSTVNSVNFVAELAQALQQIYSRIRYVM